MSGHQELEQVQSSTLAQEEVFRKAVEGAQGKLICWQSTSQIGVSALLRILDVVVFRVTEQATIAASKGVSRKLIEVAEAAGYSQEICSYHKVAIGYALLLSRGQLDVVPKVPPMLRPDFIWSPNGCQSHLWTGQALGRIFNVPVIAIDVPFEYDVANRERVLDYVENQLRGALNTLETWTGRALDWPRLQELIKGMSEVADMRNGINQVFKTCPSVCSAFDLNSASWVNKHYLVEEGKRIYGGLREEIDGKIERGERDIPDEKIRLMWHGDLPLGKRGVIREIFARHGATLCTSYWSTAGPAERGEGLDPGNPLRTVAWLHHHRQSNVSIDTRLEDWIKPGIEGYNIDGIIFHMGRTCKINGIPYGVIAAEAEEKLGVSTLILESDGVDPAFFDQAQVESRLESFFESIARRKAGAEGLHTK